MADSSQPGARASAPAPAPQFDPELARIKLPRSRVVSPVVAGAVVFITGWLMIKLRADLLYALESRTPRQLGALTVAGRDAPALPGDNRFVTLSGVPDRAFPVRVGASKSMGYRLARIVGSDGRVLLQLPGDDTGADEQGTDRYTGRTRRLSSLPYASDLRAYLRKHRVAFAVPAAGLRAVVAGGGAATLDDLVGDRVAVGADSEVVVTEEVAATAIVEVPRAAFPERSAADAVVTGLADAGAPKLIEEGRLAWRYRLPLGPRGLADTRAALRERSSSATLRPEIIEHRAAASTLKLDDDVLTLDGAQVPLSSMRRVLVYAPALSGDPLVLQIGERPGDYWFYAALYGLLLLFFAFNAWGLWSYFRESQVDRAIAAATAGAGAGDPPK